MQFRDLKSQYKALKTEIDNGIQSVLDSARFISGPHVKELEENKGKILEERTKIKEEKKQQQLFQLTKGEKIGVCEAMNLEENKEKITPFDLRA